MRLDELPDLVLHKIFLKLEAKDITSLQETNRRLYHYIRANRAYYSKYEVRQMTIGTTDQGHRIVEVQKNNGYATIFGSMVGLVESVKPKRLISYDHDELVNMHPMWWREITSIYLFVHSNYQQFLPYFDRCKEIYFKNYKRMNLSEILGSMETKNLNSFCVWGDNEVHCTNEDFRKIGRLSNNMEVLTISKMSKTSNISTDAILDMIEIGSFHNASIELPKWLGDIEDCLKRRDWPVRYRLLNKNRIEIEFSNGNNIEIGKWRKPLIIYDGTRR